MYIYTAVISAFHELMSTESAQWHHLTGVPGVLRAIFQSGLWHSMPPLGLVRATFCKSMRQHVQTLAITCMSGWKNVKEREVYASNQPKHQCINALKPEPSDSF